jgi:hypothetical protein
VLYAPGRSVRHYIERRRLNRRTSFPPLLVMLSLALPGLAFLIRGRRIIACLVAAGYLVSALVFIATLGFPAANVSYGLLISLHATNIIFVEGLWLRDSRIGFKLVAAFATVFAVWGLVYAPLVNFAEHHWFMPLRQGERVFVVRCSVPASSIKRGDWLAYEITGDRYGGDREQGVLLSGGIGIDPVLALPGDRLRFTPQAVYVNEQAFPLAPHMPTQGEFVMPQKMWFIWPTLDIYRGVRGTEASISATMERTAMVAQKQIIGRPFKRWFGRHQWP